MTASKTWVRTYEYYFVYFKKIDKVRVMNKIEVDLSQEKIGFMMLIRKNYTTGKR